MVETLKDFMARRRGEIAAAQTELSARLRALADELDEIDRAAVVVGPDTEFGALSPTHLHSRRSKQGVPDGSIQGAVLQILAEHGHGMMALQILPKVNELLNTHYPRTSLSPQLSRLKAAGHLVREGNVWKLGPAHFKSRKTDVQGHDSAPVEPSEEAEHDNMI